jgi:hypothetical protein
MACSCCASSLRSFCAAFLSAAVSRARARLCHAEVYVCVRARSSLVHANP